ncbi:DedA family protein [Campylobacter lari]|uniref:Putative membrane protein, DedA family, type II (SNARE domain) n=1 Tax=Campylobacter lari (strain RM2100 / D67 / ATCC BAA-1060) TaxID=306263 RepID=B9KCW7_CAMLR|nr:DedA family protein [Campylobacter lari]ACM64406.1 putative membrane protein, DedA family, type II (SNARE domain) [Campylobacter lari RM2100]EAC1839697.1 DedA family protein [Campylobacter lari]EAH4935431.1 DedA family protein [Campylobacter lari]EAH5176810.1 DedA family protein [Campylobacter lari]EAH6261585.1 DedA family protein [Campylobacter lari]
MLGDIIDFLLALAKDWGYWGIIFLMFVESSFFPFPSEVVMIPAGYLAHQNELNFWLCLLCGTFGALLGALLNYYLCYFLGREVLLKICKYFGVNEAKFAQFEAFFNKHGEISTFSGRLIPGLRQYISLPAGLARMNLKKFIFYTSLGAGIWCLILLILGYVLGKNEDLIKEYLHFVIIACIIFATMIVAIYIYIQKRKKIS